MTDYSSNPQQLVHDLVEMMKAANPDWNGSNTAWTNHLKASLKEMLEIKDANVRDVLFSHTESDTHEFLLDVVAWDRSEGEGVYLAAESEWGQTKQEILEDFWKLLVVKAPIKLMVFALNRKPTVHTLGAVWDGIKDCLMKYRHHQQGEHYLFIDFSPSTSAWWIEMPKSGRLDEVPPKQTITITL
jgi:hypothetical protein